MHQSCMVHLTPSAQKLLHVAYLSGQKKNRSIRERIMKPILPEASPVYHLLALSPCLIFVYATNGWTRKKGMVSIAGVVVHMR